MRVKVIRTSADNLENELRNWTEEFSELDVVSLAQSIADEYAVPTATVTIFYKGITRDEAARQGAQLAELLRNGPISG